MAETTRTLYGTTDESGCVPRAFDACEASIGPTYSEDGRIILSESFADFAPAWDAHAFEDDMRTLLDGDDYVESWGIWDCYEDDWADFDLVVYRFEGYDLAIRQSEGGICAWRGAIDTRSRVLASSDPDDCAQKCWQWRRMRRL